MKKVSQGQDPHFQIIPSETGKRESAKLVLRPSFLLRPIRAT